MSEKSEREHESTQETEGKIDLFEFFSDFLRGFRRIWWLIPALACLGGGLTFGGQSGSTVPCTRARRPLR